jgi:Zn-finger in ubiquitin-hydrolases and other protein
MIDSSSDVMNKQTCEHLTAINAVKQPEQRVCEECVKRSGQWVHLRTCQTCGVTLCCDSSPARHATAHARMSSHPVIASAEVGERWLYCYRDDKTAMY